MSSSLAAERAVDRTQDLVEEIMDDEKDEAAAMAENARSLSCSSPETANKAPQVFGRNEWIVDSGSSFDILPPSDIAHEDRGKIYTLDDLVAMNAADGQVTAEEAIMKQVFKGTKKIECLILPSSPSLLSLGR